MIKKYNLLSILILFITGMIGSAGFAPTYLWPLTALSLGYAYLSASDIDKFWRGYKHGAIWGAGYGLMNFYWVLEGIFANNEIASSSWWWMYPTGAFVIMFLGAAFFGLPFALTAWNNSRGWKRTLYFALGFAVELWIRERFMTGFPWNPLANVMMPYSAITSWMTVIGALGLTFILAGAFTAIPEYIKSKSKWQFLFLLPLLMPFFIPLPQGKITENNLNVRLIQPSIDMNQKFDDAYATNILNTLIELSKIKSNTKPDLIIWPETSYPYLTHIETKKMPSFGVPTVIGSIYYEKEANKTYNAMLITDSNGNIIDKYFKKHLAPFYEYRPFGDLFPTPGNLDEGTQATRLFNGFAPSICYEIIFSDSLINPTNNPNFILNITNDGFYTHSRGVYQHLDMVRRQAIETGLPVVRANNSGISGIIDANGKITASLPIEQRGIIDATVPPKRMTFYRRVGLHTTMFEIVLFCIIIIGISKIRKAKK